MAAKKRESLIGLLLTAVLCAGFLWWWFRPAPVREVWDSQTARQLVQRAVAEPRPDTGGTVLDLDLMEVAILQCSIEMLDEALVTAGHIVDPVVRRVAATYMARAWFNFDPSDFGQALRMEQLLPEGERGAFRSGVLEQFAKLGFIEEGLKAAQSPAQRARLGRILAETGGTEPAREILKSLSVSPDPALAEDLAGLRVHLALTDGPDEAIQAITALPPDTQKPLWLELFRLMFGRGATAAADLRAVVAAVPDEAQRWQLARESLESNIPLKQAADVVAYYQSVADAAQTPEAQFSALLELAHAQKASENALVNSKPLDQSRPESPPEAASLKAARDIAAKTPVAGLRCQRFLELASRYSESIFLTDALGCLTSARQAAASITNPPDKAAALIACAAILRLQGQPDDSRAAAEGAWQLVKSGANTPPSVLTAVAEDAVRTGDWPRSLMLIDLITQPGERTQALEKIVAAAAEHALSYNPADPPPRGHPVDAIRDAAPAHEAAAAALAQEQPAGLPRARAWLALARGVLTGKGMPNGSIPDAEPPLAPEDTLIQAPEEPR